jgi:hypothetical protein
VLCPVAKIPGLVLDKSPQPAVQRTLVCAHTTLQMETCLVMCDSVCCTKIQLGKPILSNAWAKHVQNSKERFQDTSLPALFAHPFGGDTLSSFPA